MNNSTIAAISTPPGSGGIGIIRISGELSFDIALNLFRLKNGGELEKIKIKNRYMYYGYIYDAAKNNMIDEVLVVFMKGPNSYTAEDVVEIHAHAGFYILKKILSLVLLNGAKNAEPGEFTKRAFLNGRIGLTQAEAVMDMINSKSAAAHKMAVSLCEGQLGNKIKSIQDELVDIQAHITACVDFPDDVEDLIDIDFYVEKFSKLRSEVEILISNYNIGHQIREGFKIAIVGPPNAGKSSLLNRLISKDRAIVTSKPGTTRDVIEESINLDGVPLVLSDTAGIRETDDEVEKIGVLKSKKALANSDLILFLVDGTEKLSKETSDLFNEIKHLPYIFVINKKDKENFSFTHDEEIKNKVSISALNGLGIEDLKANIFSFFEKNTSGSESSIIPNQRQHELICEIHQLIHIIIGQLQDIQEFELISFDIDSCISLCSQILGESVSPDILDKVFGDFCIGK